MTVVSRLARIGLRKGILEGSRPWLYTGLAAVTLRILGRFREQDQVVYCDELKPGEQIRIRVIKPDAR